MSLPWACSWCGLSFGRRAERAQHEHQHEREERVDYEAEGAEACIVGKALDACPYPARTWPEIEWRRGWLAAHLRRAA